MPRQTEPNANNALGDLLRSMMPGCEVRSENTQTFTDHPGRHADVLIAAPGRSPVVVEAEYEPAIEVEKDASERLGLRVRGAPRTVEAAIALRYPKTVEDAYDLRFALVETRLTYCVLRQDGSRFPESGWLDGSVSDLADIARLVSVPQKAVEQAADTLAQGIGQAATRLEEMAKLRPNVTPVIARLLGMSDVPQTRRMACAIIANAMVFHQRIAGMHQEVKTLRLVCGPNVANPQGETLTAWEDILKINYWPIFAIAKDILEQLPGNTAASILRELLETAQGVEATGVDNAHDLTGRIFQTLIADRKFLATFYTLPASAALLARLAVAKMEGVDWSSAEVIRRLRIGDFACGTGALLSAVYEQIAARHERAGGDPSALHRVMMEEVLYGCDVMPSAVHITGSTLSGVEPVVLFDSSHLYTMPYGRMKDNSVMVGSLELLQSSNVLTLFNTSDPAMRTGSVGEETATQIRAEIPDASYDVVIMNPPFTRNVTREGAYADTIAAAFAAFGASDADQRQMAKRMEVLKKDTCYHGNAGMASAFAALAHKKIKPGGVLALVLPISATVGLAWQGFRKMLADHYTGLTLLTIAAADNEDISFSSDTGMAECLVVARKLKPGETTQDRALFTSLSHRPQGFAHASSLASRLVDVSQARRIEDGPYGGTPLTIGDELAGGTVTTPRSEDGESWGAVRLSDYSLAQTAYALAQSKLWLPGSASSVELKMSSLNYLGSLGTYHLDVIGPAPRGPFNKVAPSPTATYPSLWNHDARNETKMVCDPDSQLEVRQGMEEKAAHVWATASRVHLNLDFRFNSQPLTAAFTKRASLGGRAWPNIIFSDKRFDYAFAVWANCTLGLLCSWWHSNRQVAGRGTTTITAAPSLPTLDLRALTNEQLQTVEAIFDELGGKELKPGYLADADPNRALLDRRVVCELLGFDEETYAAVRRLAAKWCAEPSVHGGKARPKGAKSIT